MQSRKESKERKENQKLFEKGFKITSFCFLLGGFPYRLPWHLCVALYAFC